MIGAQQKHAACIEKTRTTKPSVATHSSVKRCNELETKDGNPVSSTNLEACLDNGERQHTEACHAASAHADGERLKWGWVSVPVESLLH